MIPDIMIDSGAWLDIRSVSGVSPDARLLIQNKGAAKITLWEGDSAPGQGLFDGIDGYEILPCQSARTGTGRCWVFCSDGPNSTIGRIFVQEYQP